MPKLARLFPLFALLHLSCSGTPKAAPPEDLTFPKGFLFGTAIAGFQVDMGCPFTKGGCLDPNSDWYDWVTLPALVADKGLYLSGEPVTDGPGFWETYPQDLDRAAHELGSNALRLSIEWSRIFPQSTVGIEDPTALKKAANADSIAYYHALFAAMKARGLQPLVTLNHYTLPSWIHDASGCHFDLDHCTARGWLDHDKILHEIAKYAGFCAREFGGEVDLWATLNEPFTAVVVAGYVFPTAARTNPPGVMLKSVEAKAATMTMIEAHARMYDAIQLNDTVDADGDGKAARVGLVYNLQAVTPDNPDDAGDVQGAKNLDYLMNQLFLNGAINGDLDANFDGNTIHRDDLTHRMDFLGINYYARVVVQGGPASLFPKLSPLLTIQITALTQGGDYNYPRGIYEQIKSASRYHVPMMITETGFDDPMDSGKAPAWLVETLTWTKRAMAEGAPVEGYFWWTLMDNYEWNHGMSFHLGMYAVDGKDPQKSRKARMTVGVYDQIATANGISASLAAQYPAPK